MGCYGIGVTRLPAAAIEQNHDDKGIVWPRPIAPFDGRASRRSATPRSEAVRDAADELYERLAARGVDVILDDRDERPGAMFADWELIGVPLRVTVGERGLKEGNVELTVRRGMSTDAGAAFERARRGAVLRSPKRAPNGQLPSGLGRSSPTMAAAAGSPTIAGS